MAGDEDEVEGIAMPPGDPDGVEQMANAFGGVAGQLRGAAQRLRAAPSEVGSWRGASSVAFAGACLVGAGDADERADRMEQASVAARRFAADLRDARAASRRARGRAREAREEIDTAKERIADARERRQAAEGKVAAVEATAGIAGSFGAAVPGVHEAVAAARQEIDAADQQENKWKLKLDDAQRDLDDARERGREARDDAGAATRGMRGALAMLSPTGPIALAVSGPLGAGGSPAAGVSPAAVAAFFKRLGPEAAGALARSHPEAVGPLDGAPVALRYLANRALAGRAVADLEGERDEVRRALVISPGGGPLHDLLTESDEEKLQAREAELDQRLDAMRAFTAEDRNLLLFDPRGDGQVAEVFGDLERAQHATVSVPGIGNSLAGFDGEFRGEVQDLHRAANERSGGQSATVAWLGYDSPDGLSDPATYTNGAADEGGASLSRTLDGIDVLNPAAHTTVAGHSYGSVVTGQAAARHGLDADDIVLTGSPGPGAGVDHASDLAGGDARVWAAKAPGDPIAEPPTGQFDLGPGARGFDDVQNLADRGTERIHGPDPTAPEFGAERFDTGPSFEPFVETDSVDVPFLRPRLPSIEPGPLGLPAIRPSLPELDQLPVPYPTDVNPAYVIDQHTKAYAEPDSEAFRNLVRISTGDYGAVTTP